MQRDDQGYKVILDGDYFVRRSRDSDAFDIFDHARKADRDEWSHAIPQGLLYLSTSILNSHEVLSMVRKDGIVVGIAGAVRGNTHENPNARAGVWMTNSTLLDQDAMRIMQGSREVFSGFFKRWPHVRCMAWEENHLHHSWLRWLGFRETGVPVFWGRHTAKFIEFIRDEPSCA